MPSLLDPDVAERARSVAIEIGEELLELVRRPDEHDVNGERYANKDLNGTVGYALAFLALAAATHDDRFLTAMHGQLKRAVGEPVTGIGAYSGVSALRAVAQLATELEPRYSRLVKQCDDLVDEVISRMPLDVTGPASYDLVSGLSGVRLARCVDGDRNADEMTRRLEWWIADLDRLIVPEEETGEPVHYLGLAHGLAGILATLAMTLSSVSEETRELLQTRADFIRSNARYHDRLPGWPRTDKCPPDFEPAPVLCYGTPGIALTLLRVAKCIGDTVLECYAVDVLRTIAQHPIEKIRLNGLGICHGSIGLALTFYLAGKQTHDPLFARAANAYVLRTLEERESSGGRYDALGNDGERYNAMGEVYGAAGVAIGLLTICGDFHDRWLRVHGLEASV